MAGIPIIGSFSSMRVFHSNFNLVQSAVVVEYTDYISAEG